MLRNFYVGALGGSGYDAWMATLALAFLTLEVIVMIFTLRSNQARIERAEQKAKAEAEQRIAIAEQQAQEAAALQAREAALQAREAALQAREAVLQAREAVHQAWLAWAGWNERRMAAEQAGQPFAEPPPAPPAARNGSGSESEE